ELGVDAGGAEMVGGSLRRHFRRKNLFIAAGNFQVAMSAVSLQEITVPRILRRGKQAIDRDVEFRDVVLGHCLPPHWLARSEDDRVGKRGEPREFTSSWAVASGDLSHDTARALTSETKRLRNINSAEISRQCVMINLHPRRRRIAARPRCRCGKPATTIAVAV